MFALKDKVVLITGAANGIGANLVGVILNEEIKHVAIIDVDENQGISLQNELNGKHGCGKVKFIKCDVSKEEQLFEAFKTVTEEFGYIDVVVNNAGVADERNSEAIRKTIEINYIAVVNSTVKALELMRKDKGGKGGTIINVSSIGGLCQLCPALFVYVGTKSAVLQFSNCIGKKEYYVKTGVRIITVCFGVTETEILSKMRSFDDDIDKELNEIAACFPMQTTLSAALGALEALKNGESGSTWLVANNKPAIDITSTIQKAYSLFAELLY